MNFVNFDLGDAVRPAKCCPSLVDIILLSNMHPMYLPDVHLDSRVYDFANYSDLRAFDILLPE